MIFGQWLHEYSWQNCQENLFQKYILCKKNHKVWNRKYLNEKVEIERIAKKLAQTPYRYLIKEKKQRVSN